MRISVITVTWNSSATLRNTMQSVLNQSYSDVEHIIIDGASTDGTMDIVREMEPLYKGRLRYVSERDNGLYDAMNKGIGMATGHIVGILNSDDFFTDNEVLATIARQFEADTSLDAVYGDIHFVKDSDLKKMRALLLVAAVSPPLDASGLHAGSSQFLLPTRGVRKVWRLRHALQNSVGFRLAAASALC